VSTDPVGRVHFRAAQAVAGDEGPQPESSTGFDELHALRHVGLGQLDGSTDHTASAEKGSKKKKKGAAGSPLAPSRACCATGSTPLPKAPIHGNYSSGPKRVKLARHLAAAPPEPARASTPIAAKMRVWSNAPRCRFASRDDRRQRSRRPGTYMVYPKDARTSPRPSLLRACHPASPGRRPSKPPRASRPPR
jgi:hypothetical protein